MSTKQAESGPEVGQGLRKGKVGRPEENLAAASRGLDEKLHLGGREGERSEDEPGGRAVLFTEAESTRRGRYVERPFVNAQFRCLGPSGHVPSGLLAGASERAPCWAAEGSIWEA